MNNGRENVLPQSRRRKAGEARAKAGKGQKQERGKRTGTGAAKGKKGVKKGKSGWERQKLAGMLCMAIGIGAVSLALAVQALAASSGRMRQQEPEAEGLDGGQEIQRMEMASANVAVSQTEEEAAEAAPEEREDFAVPLIVVDAGHGGADRGCAAKNAEEADWDVVPEKDINLAIAQKAKAHLEAMGYRVRMVREGDQEIDTQERARLAEESGAAAYISIHQNVLEDCAVKGIEVHYNGTDDSEGRRFARLLQQQTAKKTEATELAVLEEPDLPTANGKVRLACMVKTGCLTNEEERGKLATEEYQEQVAEGIAQGVDYYFHPKTMYLTFDDGPTEENTSRVLDILKKRGIKATFFVVGENVRRHPEVARRIVEEGHTIGIHCDNHAYEAVYANVDAYLQDFETAYETVKEVTGVEVKLFRFPGGSVNAYNEKVREGIIEEMSKRGFVYFDWNASLEDAVKKSTPEQLVANGVESTLGRKKIVMLAHDVIYNTGMCLEDLLDRLPEYRMEVLTEDVEPVHF